MPPKIKCYGDKTTSRLRIASDRFTLTCCVVRQLSFQRALLSPQVPAITKPPSPPLRRCHMNSSFPMVPLFEAVVQMNIEAKKFETYSRRYVADCMYYGTQSRQLKRYRHTARSIFFFFLKKMLDCLLQLFSPFTKTKKKYQFLN